MAQSLTKSSASLVAAGGDLAEAAALTATANAIIQDADAVGTALKTTSLRLRGTSVEVLEEEGVDSDGAVTSKSKLQSKVKALSGVDILTETGDYKSTYQILSQIADVWEDISNMDQAALLELLAGKRNASVLAAILQSPEQLKAAYEDANNAAGSALKENEKYLDSIQGKIDQFNNAMQTMWSNTLESDAVKNIVALGTELIKIIDKLGLLNIAVAGLSVFLNKKYNFVDFSNLFTGFKEAFSNSKGSKDFFQNLISGFKNTEISVEKATEKLAELEEQKAKLGDPKSEKNRRKVDILDQEINKYKEMLAPSEDLIAAQNKLKAAQDRLANTKSTNPKTLKQYQREIDKAKANVDKLTVAQKKSGKTGNTAFTGLGKSVKKFGKQVTSVITQMLVMWAITKVIELLAKGFDNLITTAEEAAEKYEELNSELDTLKSNIEDINGELSTLNDRIAELTAKGSLSFTEKEELERLRAEREELERTLELNQQLANQKQQQVNNQTSGQVEYYRNKGVKSGKTTGEIATTGAIAGGAVGIGATAAFGAKLGTAIGTAIAPGVGSAVGAVLGVVVGGIVGTIAGAGIGGIVGASEEKVGESIENMEEKLAEKEEAVKKAREKYQNSGKDGDKEKYEKAQKALSDYRGEMAQYFTEIDAMYQNVDLSTIEDPDEYKRLKEEMNDFYNERDKWLITSGAEGAESNAIGRIFDKDDYENASKTIDNLVKKLEKDPTDQNAISQISELCKVAEEDLKAVGLEVQDATDYFTMLGQNAAFGTIEGKVAEISSATSKLQTLLSNTNSADFTSLFGQGGEVSKTAIAEYFQGTSEETRTEIARLVKAINDGEISVENALKQFELFTIQSVIDIQIKEVQTNFKDVFTDLEDADGLIDTFKELGEAIGSTVGALDALNKANGEMAYSGRVSIQTALELMQYTDNYADVLEVVDGKLQLNKNAEENLINARINAMKVSAQTALADAQAAYEKAKLATQTYNDALTTDMSASVVAKAWEKVLAAGAGLVEGIKSLFTGESWTEAYNRSYNKTLSNMTGYETTYNDAGLQALKDAEAEAEQAVKNAQGNIDLLGEINAGNIKEMYESDDIEDPEDAAKTKLEEKMEEFQKAMDYWENRTAANQARYEQLQNEIDLLESQGKKAGAEYYEEQIDLEEERLRLLEKQKKAAKSFLGTFAEGSEEWWEVATELNNIESEIDDVTKSIQELSKAIAEVNWYGIEEPFTRFDNHTDTLANMRELIAPNGEEDWFDDEGNWTEKGVAVAGTHIQEIAFDEESLEYVKKTLGQLNLPYEGNEQYYKDLGLGINSEQDLYDKREELQKKEQEYQKNIKDNQQAIVDMYKAQIDAVEEWVNQAIESYHDYIDVVKEALDAERDLYDFKKNIKKQSSDIAKTERKIASLSGSDNAADIAERRKLEAELAEQRESLNDTYYDHAMDARSKALDDEAKAYEEAMNKFVEGLRTSLNTALTDMGTFMTGVYNAVISNAPTITGVYDTLGLSLDSAIIDPWTKASEAIKKYQDGDGTNLGLAAMNSWIAEGGIFPKFKNGAEGAVTDPWKAGNSAVQSFRDTVDKEMAKTYGIIQSNVAKSKKELEDLYSGIQDTPKTAPSTKDGNNNPGNNPSGNDTVEYDREGTGETALQKAIREAQAYVDAKGFSEGDKARWGQDFNFRPLLQAVYAAGGTIDDLKGKVYAPKGNTTSTKTQQKPKFQEVNFYSGISIGKRAYNKSLEIVGSDGTYYPWTNLFGQSGYIKKGEGYTVINNDKMDVHSGKQMYKKLAKGTTGTTHDQWAITDEPQFGDELVLVPGKDGNLSFMRKGTGVVPADMTQKLFELAQIPTSDLMRRNITAIIPDVTKNDITNQFNFDSLVHVDHCDQNTLKDLEKMVDNKINDFSKQMNYSLKKFAR